MEATPSPGTKFARRLGAFELTESPRVLKRDGRLILLPPKAIDTLFLLVQNAGNVVDKEHFFRSIWPGVYLAESSLTKNISILRKVLDDGNVGTSVTHQVGSCKSAHQNHVQHPSSAFRDESEHAG